MSSTPSIRWPELTSRFGPRLYALLPEVYRNRETGDGLDRTTGLFLDAMGELLDLIDATLDQRLADCFPDDASPGPDQRTCQDWLLPYFADLLGATLVSPDSIGRRREVARAIEWRQRRGTRSAAEDIAESIMARDGRDDGAAIFDDGEAELSEGFRLVAVTARIGEPLLDASAFGEPTPDRNHPASAASHPGLPAVMIDFRPPSRMVTTTPTHPLAGETRFRGTSVTWRPLHPRGAPCFPGSWEDSSKRTVDLRSPDHRRGHVHPKRVIVRVAPPIGAFPRETIRVDWADRADHGEVLELEWRLGGEPIEHDGDLDAPPADPWDELVVRNPSLATDAPRAVLITGGLPDFDHEGATLRFEGVNAASIRVIRGRFEGHRSVIERAIVEPVGSRSAPSCVLIDALVVELEAASSWVGLETSTVMQRLRCLNLLASDSILPGEPTGLPMIAATDGEPGCVRYSRVPPSLLDLDPAILERAPRSLTTARPVYCRHRTCTDDDPPTTTTAATFGAPGFGVLSQDCPAAIRTGAEDGGELGAFHHQRHALQAQAVVEKLEGFIPLGMRTPLSYDARLLSAPPSVDET